MDLVYHLESKFNIGYAHSITDINDDFQSDLILTTNEDNKIVFKVLSLDVFGKQYALNESYNAPENCAIYGQSLFADFGRINFLKYFI
jgi:hypothetical protein